MAITGLRLRCALADCQAITVEAPSGGVTAGDFGSSNDTNGLYATSQDAEVDVALIYFAPAVIAPAATADSTVTYAVGDIVYYDATNGEITNTASGNDAIGTVREDAVAGDTEVEIALDGRLHLS